MGGATIRLWSPVVLLFHASVAGAFFANHLLTEEGNAARPGSPAGAGPGRRGAPPGCRSEAGTTTPIANGSCLATNVRFDGASTRNQSEWSLKRARVNGRPAAGDVTRREARPRAIYSEEATASRRPLHRANDVTVILDISTLEPLRKKTGKSGLDARRQGRLDLQPA